MDIWRRTYLGHQLIKCYTKPRFYLPSRSQQVLKNVLGRKWQVATDMSSRDMKLSKLATAAQAENVLFRTTLPTIARYNKCYR